MGICGVGVRDVDGGQQQHGLRPSFASPKNFQGAMAKRANGSQRVEGKASVDLRNGFE
jgi:hypothetical protein